ncbi:MAG: type sorting protein [Bacteroidetes bacterium]|jgi:hypothetical protein|nr:type sorting protein [Bacteroidota bacterium]
MKNNYFKVLIIAFMIFSVRSYSQCSSCTTTITGNDASNYVVSAGNTLCISATGNATGLITVGPGGILCNAGFVNSSNLWVAGGALENFGTINTSNILVSGQGMFNNNGTVQMDSLHVTNMGSQFFNQPYGTIIGIRLGNSDSSTFSNDGNITVDYMADSAAFFQNGSTGSFIVNVDFANAYNSSFWNSGYYKVMRDFYNSTGSTFDMNCMGIIGRDWYNSALIYGPQSGCGGFNITGGSYNSGAIGTSSSYVDICDAGNPTFGLDGPGGTISTTTTYCACSNSCVQGTIGIESFEATDAIILALYPNPAVNSISLLINAKRSETMSIEVFDMMGKKQLIRTMNSVIGENKLDLDISQLVQGTYILNVIDENQLQTKQMFNVLK